MCKFCDSNENETSERIYWKCKDWAEVREKSPLSERFIKKLDVRRSKRVVLNSDRMTICTLKRKWSKIQWVMATILKTLSADFVAGDLVPLTVLTLFLVMSKLF